jgi:hypothetical protein
MFFGAQVLKARRKRDDVTLVSLKGVDTAKEQSTCHR